MEFSGQANGVSVQLIPGFEATLLTSHKGLPAVEEVCRRGTKHSTFYITFLAFRFHHATIRAPTFVTHDCDVHSGLFQHPETLPLTAVLHVTEVKARHKDPEAKVGSLVEELGQSEGAVGAWRPGAEPGNGVTEPFLSSAPVAPKTRAQSS